MKYQLAHIVAAAAMLFAASACEDTTSNIGSSLVNDDVKIVIDSAFTANGRSVAIQSIRPKTVTQILGKIDVPEYGRLSSSVVSQFLPSTELDTANFVPSDVDSLILTLRYANGSFIGDSVAPMGVNVYLPSSCRQESQAISTPKVTTIRPSRLPRLYIMPQASEATP